VFSCDTQIEFLHFIKKIISNQSQVMGVFYPSTQHHYRRLILLFILLYCYMFRSYDHHQEENILLARITQLTTDPFFYNIANIIVIVL
jgi:hypothetical protein